MKKIKLSKSDDSVTIVRVLCSDQSTHYSTFFTVSSEKSGIAS